MIIRSVRGGWSSHASGGHVISFNPHSGFCTGFRGWCSSIFGSETTGADSRGGSIDIGAEVLATGGMLATGGGPGGGAKMGVGAASVIIVAIV